MALFNFKRKNQPAEKKKSAATPPQPIEELKAKARNRLIGAIVLLLIAFIGFPLLFSRQPHPLPEDLPIIIPQKSSQPSNEFTTTNQTGGNFDKSPSTNTGHSINAPAKNTMNTNTVAPDLLAASEKAKTITHLGKVETPKIERPKAEPAKPITHQHSTQSTNQIPKAASQEATKQKNVQEKDREPIHKPAILAQPTQEQDQSAQILAILNGKSSDLNAHQKTKVIPNRYIVQVGAFATTEKTQEVRRQLEKIGLQTYTQELKTLEGTRIRVRIGPYTEAASAEKIASKVSHLGFTPDIIKL